MWEDELTEELIALYDVYKSMFGLEPEDYIDVDVSLLSYSEYVNLIKLCIKHKKSVEEITDYDLRGLL